ncbi:phosphatase PAP2 family protein [Streptomyces sp. BH-SS-21]|uniref:Phosphatase PAP2 family protein n=1 Tax=Streptomyces liliiviolaceus TaxID=2823109 RepID=A0A941BBG5_9ACTN|nr:phosphatase PAP2 family protein [Streptomyces liliiviolaceus]MBQ0853677.1 phosphatase PAP2 family protein [Streptomyces liliiviolaceus]
MHSPVDSPPHATGPGIALRVATALALPTVLLIVLVTASWDPLMALDGDIARTTHRWAVDDPDLTQAFRILTDWVWDPWTMRALIAVTVLWLVLHHGAWWLALWLTATLLVAGLLSQGIKAAVDRDRPVWPDPVDSAHFAAFPSGHAMTATVACGLLLWVLRLYGTGRVLWRIAVAVAVVSVAGVGFTRIWLGVHWSTDVLAGWLLGASAVALAVVSYARCFPPARST